MNHSFLKKFCLAATLPLYFSAGVVHAAEFETLSIKQQTSHYMDMKQRITRIAVGDPAIATVVQLPGSANEFLIVTKAVKGSTALFVWTIDGVRHEYLIVVSPEDPGQAMLIEKAIGLPNVHVKMVGERILLTGTVENQYEKNLALQTARLFVAGNTESSLLVGSGFDMELDTDTATSSGRSGDVELAKSEATGEIIDLLQILHPTQIRLEAQIIILNSEDVKNLGIQYGTSGSGGIFYFGENYPRDWAHTHFNNNPFRWVGENFSPINATITALITQGKGRILSRPTVTTLSGEQATIQIGGQIPYSTYDNNGRSKTDFKDYGVILQFKPVVDAQNRINSAIHAEVSSPSTNSVDGQPMIDTRSADSVISLHSGFPIVIGGLMNSEEIKNTIKIPLLGDIPILGELFKYTSKSRDKREIIIVVTPYLVEQEELSQAPMSQTMRQWYDQNEQQREAMEPHDFKKPEEEVIVEVEPEPERILPPPNYPKDGKVTSEPFKN